VKIRLKRIGKIRVPQYRIVVADSRTRRSGRAIEELGLYHPKEEPSLIRVDSERVQHWLKVGAQPTEPVLAILKVTGDWQRFTGEPGAEGTLKVAEPKADKARIFEAAAKQAVGEKDRVDQARAKAAKKAAESRQAGKGSGGEHVAGAEPDATTAEAVQEAGGQPPAEPVAEPEAAAAAPAESAAEAPAETAAEPSAAEAPAEAPADETPKAES
jgi:small subunit ribosomal protein S16